MQKDQTAINQALDLIRVSRNLERVADLATNIAEEVIFFAEAHVVKHHQMDRPPRAFWARVYDPIPPVVLPHFSLHTTEK